MSKEDLLKEQEALQKEINELNGIKELIKEPMMTFDGQLNTNSDEESQG